MFFSQTVFHESPCAMSQPQESPRSSRSNSLKPQSQVFLFPSRPKRRTLSLPSKPIIPPHIIIQGCHNNNDTQSEEEEKERSEVKKENMGKGLERYLNEIVLNQSWKCGALLSP